MVTYPKDWEVRKTSEFGDIITGNTPSTDNKLYWGKSYLWVTPTDIGKETYIFDSGRKLSLKGFEQTRFLPAGSILITCIASIGKNCIIASDGSCNQQINAIVPFKNYDNVFIYYFMNFNKEILENKAGITATKILKKSTFEKIEWVVPNLPEQLAISSILSDFDEHIETLDKLIQKKKDIRNGALEDLVSGKTRLKGFNDEWHTIPFSKYFKFLSTNTLSREQLSDSGNIYNVHYGDILVRYGCILSENEFIPKVKDEDTVKNNDFLIENDVIIADTAEDETVGKAVQIGKIEGKCVSGLHTFACRPIYPTANKYLGYYINSKSFHEQLMPYVTGIKVSSISKTSIKKTEVCIPSDITEQKAIADILTSMDNEIDALEKEKEKFMQLKEAAMEDLLTGKVRLKI